MYYTLYQVNNKVHSNIRGYWIYKNKLYKDYIHLRHYKDKTELDRAISALFKAGQKAVFYTKGEHQYIRDRAFIIDKEGHNQVLKHKIELIRDKLSIKEFKILLKQYGGLTIFKLGRYYKIEVYHA